MDFVSLNCPQCGGLLPRAAIWRTVKCPYCGALVTRSEKAVEARNFHAAWLRTRVPADPTQQTLRLEKTLYRLLARLGSGETSVVYLADKLDPLPERVVIREALPGMGAALEREHAALMALQALDGPGAAYFSQRLPQPVALGLTESSGRTALVTRHIPGCWGSLAAVMRRHPQGIDPRHGVWIWRRILDTLGYLHGNGWVHGDVHPGHVLVQPQDHGAFLIGWGRAREERGRQAVAADLGRSAWTIRALLHGLGDGLPGVGPRTPPAFAGLLAAVSGNPEDYAERGAQGIDAALKAAAREDFGPPRFVHFEP